MKQIELTQGKSVLVDDSDYEMLSEYNWFTQRGNKTFYANCKIAMPKGQKMLTMATAIMKQGKGLEVDHIDGNGLNNQRSNLRIATRSQNQANRPKNKNNTSGYKGVSWNKGNKKWQVIVRKNGKTAGLGSFTCLIKAAKKYDEFMKETYKEFAVLNFPD